MRYFPAPSLPSTPATPLGALERAIYSTIAYRDVFDFPVTVDEIHRYLHGIRCGRSDVEAGLHSEALGARLESDGMFFALRGRAALFALRRERWRIAEQRRPLAVRFARFLANLPNVRMVAMTGSMAVENSGADGDIDFLLLTDRQTMWRTRGLCRLLARLDARLGRGLFCPNVFLSRTAMTLERRTLYDAQELAQMIPLFGFTDYADLRTANGWTAEFLPNAAGPPRVPSECPPFWRGAKTGAEWLLDSPLGRGLERLEARRKMRLFNETDHLKGAWTRSTHDRHLLWDDMRLDIERAWQRRMETGAPD